MLKIHFDTAQPNFRKLLAIVNGGERRVIPFVGAGLSIYGSREESLPQWSELVRILMDKAVEHRLIESGSDASLQIESLISQGKLISATDLLVNDILGIPTFRKTIQETLDVSQREIPPAMLELVTVTWSLIITTNLDNFIERAWAHKHGVPITVLTNRDSADLNSSVSGHSSNPILLKTHGTLERFETWVLSKSHYDDILNTNQPYVEALKLLYRQTLFFIGFGLSDRDFEPLLEQLKRIYPAGIGDYYALVPESDSERYIPLMRNYGLQPIWYKVHKSRKNEPDGGYVEVQECLSLIASAWLRSSQDIPVVLKYFPEFEKGFQGRSRELSVLTNLVIEQQVSAVQVFGFGGEGKTSLVQKWIDSSIGEIIKSGYALVFGCSFYKADIGRFIDALYNQLVKDGDDFDIASKVSRICVHLKSMKIMLILDGLEVIQSSSGELENSYMQDIIDSASSGLSTIIVTTRLKIPDGFHTLNLSSLDFDDAVAILKKWDVSVDSEEDKDVIRNHIGLHALSVRIMAGHLKANKSVNLGSLHGISLSNDIFDEADSLKANKATRILDFYQGGLSFESVSFMKAFSIYSRSVPEPLIIEAFGRSYNIATVTDCLTKEGLVSMISELKERRLLLAENDSFLTCHPLVRDYFRIMTCSSEVKALHVTSMEYFLRVSPEFPSSLSECFYLFSACYHAAKAEDYDSYHNIFFERLNLEQKRFLGFSLAGWDECYELALLSFADENPKLNPALEKCYYLGITAYSLSRLFRNDESIPFYLRSIWEGIHGNSDLDKTENAIQSNCLVSTLLLMGKYELAVKFIGINLYSLTEVRTDDHRQWQTEHAYTTIGRLAARVGSMDKSLKFYKLAGEVRDSGAYDVKNRHELERITHIDSLLAADINNIAFAEKEALEILQIGENAQFPDIVCGAYRILATIERHKAKNNYCKGSIKSASQNISRSLALAQERRHMELEIQARIEKCKILILIKQNERFSDSVFREQTEGEITHIKRLLERSKLYMYSPELHYVEGAISQELGELALFKEHQKQLSNYHEQRGDCILEGFQASKDKSSIANTVAGAIPDPDAMDWNLCRVQTVQEFEENSKLLGKIFGFSTDWLDC